MNKPSSVISNSAQTKKLHQILSLHLYISQVDFTLAEEMAKGCGSHKLLTKLIRLDVYSVLSKLYNESLIQMDVHGIKEVYEQDEDALVEIQDLACSVAYANPNPSISYAYPVKMSPYTIEELQNRLPLVFHINSPNGNQECLMVGQVVERQSAQEDVGFVMWPSAVVLASWLLDHSDLLRENTKVLEIGSGCGLTGLVAARMMKKKLKLASQFNKNGDAEADANVDAFAHADVDVDVDAGGVILSDFNQKVLANLDRNIEFLNDLRRCAKPLHLDFYVQGGTNREGGWKGTLFKSLSSAEKVLEDQPGVDLVLAADTICKPADSVAVSNTIYDALVPGGEAIVVLADAKHRFGVDIFDKECRRNNLEVITTNV